MSGRKEKKSINLIGSSSSKSKKRKASRRGPEPRQDAIGRSRGRR